MDAGIDRDRDADGDDGLVILFIVAQGLTEFVLEGLARGIAHDALVDDGHTHETIVIW